MLENGKMFQEAGSQGDWMFYIERIDPFSTHFVKKTFYKGNLMSVDIDNIPEYSHLISSHNNTQYITPHILVRSITQ